MRSTSANIHIPTSKKSKYPGGIDYHKDFYYAYDPIVALTVAASVTSRTRLGTFIILLAQRDPSAGWNPEEMGDHAVPFRRRWPRFAST